MKGISPIVTSVILIVITIGISTALLPSILKQTNEPLSEAKKQSATSIDCANAHFNVISASNANGELALRLHNTGMRDFVEFEAYANTPKGRVPFIYSLIGSPAQGSVVTLVNTTFPYGFADHLTIVSKRCPNAKKEISLSPDPSLSQHLNFDESVSDSSSKKNDPTFYGDTLAVFSFEELSGDAIDQSSYKNNGIITGGAVRTSGISGQSMNFDGVDDAVTLTVGSIPTGNMTKVTAEFWMYWNGTQGQMPFGFTNYDLYFSNGGFGFNTFSSEVYGINSSGLAHRWVHVVAEFTNNNTLANKLYIDGVLQNLSYYAGNSTASRTVSNSVRLGGYAGGTGYRFRGRIDEFALYGRALTPEEVQDHYTAQKAKMLSIPFISGTVNTGIVFDGIDDYIEIPYSDSLSLVNSSTIAFWIKLTSDPDTDAANNWRALFYPKTGVAPIRIILEQQSVLSYSVRKGSTDYRYINTSFSSEQLTVGTWTHLAYVFNHTTGYGYAYKDGVLDSSKVNWRISWPSGTPTPTSSGALPAIVDDFRIYERALNPAEIVALYENYRP
jgi:flagellin-like protein